MQPPTAQRPVTPAAQPNPAPPSPFPQLELPATAAPPVVIPQNSAVEKRIRKALSGESSGGTGDPVLDDILGVLNKRGSILDGSTLDAADVTDKNTAGKATERFHAAELLLRTSRCMEKIGPLDSAQRDLIKQMRGQARHLLNTTDEP